MKRTGSRKRVYVDTSVVGGVFEKEFQKRTEPFWSAVHSGIITIIVSDNRNSNSRRGDL